MNDVLRPERKGMRRVRGAEKVVLGSERKGMRRVRGAEKAVLGSERKGMRRVRSAENVPRGWSVRTVLSGQGLEQASAGGIVDDRRLAPTGAITPLAGQGRRQRKRAAHPRTFRGLWR